MSIPKFILWFLACYFLIIAPAVAFNLWFGFVVAAGVGLAQGLYIGNGEDEL